ncbi:MAG: hypothetical protein PVJ67_00820 [Candidatus Pacearchaeota archaeon]|jgi:hypothetical protein
MIIDTPRIGERKEIMLPPQGIFQRPKIVNGFFIGYNLLQTNEWKKLTKPEGFSFLVLGEDDQQIIYSQRKKELEFTYWDDCDNCPYPMGIEASEVKGFKLNPLELEFVKTKINKLNPKLNLK